MPMAMAALVATGYFGGYLTAKKKPAASIKGDYVAISPEQFTNVYHSSLRVDRFQTLEEKCNDSTEVNHFGSGVLLRDSQTGENYVLTAEHMTPGSSYSCEENGSKREIKVREGHLTVAELPAAVIITDEKVDHALLKIEGKMESGFFPYQGKIASQLHNGDYVIGVGFPNGKHTYFIANVKEKEEDITLLNVNEIIGGNSGGGVYRCSDQGLELIGTVKGGTTITSLKKLREFLKGTPLEDDYL